MSGASNHSTITVAAEADHARSWSSHMEQLFGQTPDRLKPSAGTCSCYIFRVPKGWVESNANAYKPRIVSIGPYHHGEDQLMMIEQHKPRVLSTLVNRTRGGTDLEAYFNAVALWETDIRDSYSEALHWNTKDLIGMMILDACFIVESFRFCTGVIPRDTDDPLFTTPWIVSSLTLDLLLIENQIPFFVLQRIYDLSKSPSDCSLNEIALGFFNLALQWPEENFQKHYGVCNITHLLDLFRLSLVGHLGVERPGQIDEESQQLIPSTNQLLLDGIKFKPRKSENLTDVSFDRGVLQIPTLTLDLFTSSFFLNCVAYEQCYHYCSKHISTYVFFMRCLTSTAADAVVLSQHNIIENFLGTDEEVARFFNDLTKEVPFNSKLNYLAEIFKKVAKYRRNKCRLQCAGIMREYFGNTWSVISAAAAFTLLVLTFVQAFFTVYPYYHSKK